MIRALEDGPRTAALLCDLRQYYGIDLREYYRGEITLIELAHYYVGLPYESRSVKLEGPAYELDLKDHLLLSAVDSLARIEYFSAPPALANIDRKDVKKFMGGMPKRTPRPGDPPEEVVKPRMSTPEELGRHFGLIK